MIDKLKEMAKEKNIQIVYGSLPPREEVLFIARDDLKVIMIDMETKDTDKETLNIALGLGHFKAKEDLNIDANPFKEEDKKNYDLLIEKAKEYQIDIIYKINLELLHEIIKDKTEEKINEFIKGAVEFMIEQKQIEDCKIQGKSYEN